MDEKRGDMQVEEMETVDRKSISRLGQCEVCAIQDAKYTCPRCEVKTCGLKCSKIHKLELECNGERDRTKYIPLNKFTNIDISSDYRLLEEISRSLESSRKKFGRRPKYFYLPQHLFKLKTEAKSRHVQLKFLPYQFLRRRINSTYYKAKLNTIFWHIQWKFVNADNLELSDQRIPETEKLAFIVSKYFDPQKDKVLSEKLQYYQATGLSGVKLLLKAEQKGGNRFYELDPSLTIKECLLKKSIVEFPIIYVVLKDHAFGYDLIDSDDEDNTNKTGNDVIRSIIKNVDSTNKSMKNLLFVSNCTDEETSSDE